MKPAIEVPEFGREITVGDGSPVTMNIGDNVTAASNTTITIRCPVSGVPTPSVTWTKDGADIIPEDEISITDNDSLVIKGANIEDSANYTCNVQSKFGKDDITSAVQILGWCLVPLSPPLRSLSWCFESVFFAAMNIFTLLTRTSAEENGCA